MTFLESEVLKNPFFHFFEDRKSFSPSSLLSTLAIGCGSDVEVFSVISSRSNASNKSSSFWF